MLTLFVLFVASANAYLCCIDVWDNRATLNCQQKNTPPNQDKRTLPQNSWKKSDTSTNALRKVKSAYADFPADDVCCMKACCHKTTYRAGGGYSRGKPHIRIDCPNDAGVPLRFRGAKHYNCNDGRLQAFTRRLDDQASQMTIASNAPKWVELKAPEPRRVGDDEEGSSETAKPHSGDENKTSREAAIRRSYYATAMAADGLDATEHKIAYIGCFTDDGSRDLPHYKGSGFNTLSCSEKCHDHVYFALQHNGQCFCGDRYGTSPAYYKTEDAECGLDLKGGAYRNAIFIHNVFDSDLTVYDHDSFQQATLSSTYAKNDASRCVDGDLSTSCKSGFEDRAWLRFELVQAVTVVKVMVAVGDSHQARLGRFHVLLKTANGWKECHRGVVTDTSKQWQEVWCWRPTKASKVQIQFDEDHEMSYLQIADVKILGRDPAPQYVGCIRDDDERAFKHYKGEVDSIEECRNLCDPYHYFAMQNEDHCFCDDGYANDGRYPGIDDSLCGSDRRGMEMTNAVYVTHGGLYVQKTEVDRRRFGWGGHIWKPPTWEQQMQWWLDDIVDDLMTYGECAVKQFEHWRNQHPYEAIFVEILAAIVLVAFLPEEIVGVGIIAGGEVAIEAVEIVEEIIDVIPEVPKEVPGGSVVNDIVKGLGGLFGRRRLSKTNLKGDANMLQELSEQFEKLTGAIEGEEAHSNLLTVFEALLEASSTRHELLRKEFVAFDKMMGSMDLELDDEMMSLVTVYFEAFDDLLETDIETAATCLQSGCTLAKIDTLLSESGATSSGEGEGFGSATPNVEPKAASGTTSDSNPGPSTSMTDSTTESDSSWPEVDNSKPKDLLTMDNDGWVRMTLEDDPER